MTKVIEKTYDELAQDVLAELTDKMGITEKSGPGAPKVVQGEHRHVGPQVWVLVWSDGPEYWAHDYQTRIKGLYLMAYSGDATMIHLDHDYLFGFGRR